MVGSVSFKSSAASSAPKNMAKADVLHTTSIQENPVVKWFSTARSKGIIFGSTCAIYDMWRIFDKYRHKSFPVVFA